MPIANTKYTTLKSVAVPFSLSSISTASPSDDSDDSVELTASAWTYLMASNVKTTQNMPISSVKLTLGAGQTPIRDIDNIETTYNISGPCIIEDSGFLYNRNSGTMCVPSFILEYLYYSSRHSQYLQGANAGLEYPANPPSLYFNREKPIVTSAKLSIGNDGLNGELAYSGFHFGPQEKSTNWQTPGRQSRWYDFYIDLYSKEAGTVKNIGTYKMNADITFTVNYIEMPYIGQAQFKKYVYNGATMKWSVKALFDDTRKWPTVTRQDGMYSDFSESYLTLPEYLSYTTTLASEQVIPSKPAKSYSTGIIMKARANYNTVSTDFKTRFEAAFNNIVWQEGVAFEAMGYETKTTQLLGNSEEQTAFGFISNVNVNMAFPLSDFTISGEKVFA